VDRVHDVRLTGPYAFWLGNMYTGLWRFWRSYTG
jgi:hypothetical protein